MSGDKVKRVDTSSQKAAAEAARQARYAANNKRENGISAETKDSLFGNNATEIGINTVFVGIGGYTVCNEGKKMYKARKAGQSIWNSKTVSEKEKLETLKKKKTVQETSTLEEKSKKIYNVKSKKILKARKQFFLDNPDAKQLFDQLKNCEDENSYKQARDNFLNTGGAAERNKREELLKKTEEYFDKKEKKNLRNSAIRREHLGKAIDAQENYLSTNKFSFKGQKAAGKAYREAIGANRMMYRNRKAPKTIKNLGRTTRRFGRWGKIASIALTALPFLMSAFDKTEQDRNATMNLHENKVEAMNTKQTAQNVGNGAIEAAPYAGMGLRAVASRIPGVNFITGLTDMVAPLTQNIADNKVNNTMTEAEKYEEELTKKFESGSMTETEITDFVEIQKRRNKDILTNNIACSSKTQIETLKENQAKVNKALIALGYNPIPNIHELDIIDETTGINVTAEMRKNAVKQIKEDNKAYNEQLDAELRAMGEKKLKEKCKELDIKFNGDFSEQKARKAIKQKIEKTTSKKEIRAQVAKMPTNEVYSVLGLDTEYKAMVLGIDKEATIEAYKEEAEKAGKELTDEEIGELEAQIDKEINEAYNDKEIKKTTQEMNQARLTMTDEEYEDWSTEQVENDLKSQKSNTNPSRGAASGVESGETIDETEETPSENTDATTTAETEKKEEAPYVSPAHIGFNGLWDGGIAASTNSDYKYNFWEGFTGNNTYTNNYFGNYTGFGNNYSFGLGQNWASNNIWQYSQPFSAYQYDNGMVPNSYMPMSMMNNWWMFGNNNGNANA